MAKLTPAEKSAQCRAAALARKNKRGGRPKGWRKDPTQISRKVMKSIGVYEEDYNTFRTLANATNQTMAETMHQMAQRRIEANPDLFSNRPEVNM